MDEADGRQNNQLEVICTVFRDGGTIPKQYTCRGRNVNPPLNILNVPEGTVSLVLIMHDPDAVGGDYVHWLMWDIPSGTEVISVNSVPIGAIQGKNSAGKNSYTGPCPPKGTGIHNYIFDFYALSTSLNLPSDSTFDSVIKSQKEHVLDHASLSGLFSAES